MSDEQGWRPVEGTLGLGGAEGGTIVRDEEHPAGLRLTREEDVERSFHAVTCVIAGWLVHARHFGSAAEAEAAWDELKPALVQLAMQLPATRGHGLDPATREAGVKLGAFLARYP